MASSEGLAPTPSTKAESAYFDIRRTIANGTLPPGHVLDQEQLARELEMSTTPLREALRRLESEGFVELSLHRDVRVRPLSKVEMRDLYGVRLVLEPYAARLGTLNAKPSDLDALDAEIASRPEDIAELAEHYHAVHRLVYGLCGNRFLVSMLDRLNDRAGRYRALCLPLESDIDATAMSFHQKLATAFRQRDGDRVAVLVHAHLMGAMHGFSRGDELWGDLADVQGARSEVAG